MSQAGWYPDPGGQPGMFRYWDGQAWSPTLSPTPYAPAPLLNQPHLAVRSGEAPYPSQQSSYAETPRRRPWGSFLVIALVVAALVVGGGFLITSGIIPNPLGRQGGAPSNPTDFCPKRRIEVSPAPRTPHPPGRIQGGKLSMPQLGAPWTGPYPETRVPFGRDVYEQHVVLHENFDKRGWSWVASLLVGELVAGDGFFSPKDGSEIVSKCVMGEFYSDAVLTRTDRVNQATTVDGHDAWVVEMHLGFTIAGLAETGETAIIIIVTTGQESSSIYYASVPDSRPDLLEQARRVQQQLRVEG